MTSDVKNSGFCTWIRDSIFFGLFVTCRDGRTGGHQNQSPEAG